MVLSARPYVNWFISYQMSPLLSLFRAWVCYYEVHTIVETNYGLFLSAASMVAKNISLTTRNFFSFIALAFRHCTGVNVVMKKNSRFRRKKLYALSARFICHESLVCSETDWKNLRNKLATPLRGSRYYKLKLP